MASDRDTYGRVLGKRFLALRGVLCGSFSREEKVDACARYLRRLLRKELPDFHDHIQEVDRSLSASPSFFMAENVAELQRRTVPDSLAGEDLRRATRKAISTDGDAKTVISDLSAAAMSATQTRAKLQNDYRDDSDCHEVLAEIGGDTRERLARMLREDCRLQERPKILRSQAPQADMLDLVLAQQ